MLIPNTNDDLKTDFEIEIQPSKTYKIEDNKIVGFCDNVEAIKQTIYCILNTERFDYLIYSWNYGVELKNLIGKQKDYIMSELKRLIKEALIQDDRIEDVTNFEFTNSKNSLNVKFTVQTTDGVNIEAEKVVNI